MSATKTPAMVRLSWDPADPYPFYEQCRARGDVVWVDNAHAWLIVGYHAARRVLGEPGWSSDPRVGPSRDAITVLGSDLVERLMLLTDGAHHRRLRDAVRDVFTPAFIDGLTEGVEAIAHAVIDHPTTGQPFEFMTDIALPLPLSVAADWLGLGFDSADLLRTNSPAIIRMLGALASANDINAGAAAFGALVTEILPLAADRRAQPGDDLLSFIATDPTLNLDDVVITTILIAVAGHETTANLLGAAMIRLLRPAQDSSRLIDDIDPCDPSLFNELLRLDGPVHATARTATQQHQLEHTTINPGDPVIVVIAAANRDPTVFDQPDHFRLNRAGPSALSFGYGAHYCLGAALARLETTTALRRIIARKPRLTAPATWRDTPAIRGPFTAPMLFNSD